MGRCVLLSSRGICRGQVDCVCCWCSSNPDQNGRIVAEVQLASLFLVLDVFTSKHLSASVNSHAALSPVAWTLWRTHRESSVGCVGQTTRKIAAVWAFCPLLGPRLKIPSCGSCSPTGQTPSVSRSVRVIRAPQLVLFDRMASLRARWALMQISCPRPWQQSAVIPLLNVLVGLENKLRSLGRKFSRLLASDDDPDCAT